MLNGKSLGLFLIGGVLAFFSLILNADAMQMERNFPVDVKRGKLSTTPLAELVIDGKLRLHSPALRIYSEDNLTLTIASVDVRNIMINYVENEFGEIQRIWVLTAEEARQPLPKKN